MSRYAQLPMVAKIVLPVGGLLVLALSLLTWQIQQRSSVALTSAAEREMAALAGSYGNDMRAFMESATNASQTMADALSASLTEKRSLPRDTLSAIHHGMQMGNDMFVGTGSIWLPNAFDGRDADFTNALGSDAKGRFVPYSQTGSAQVVALQDYETTDYFKAVMSDRKPFLSTPYFYDLKGKSAFLTTAASPVMVNNAVAGVVFTDILLEPVAKLISAVKIYDTGYGGLLTADGVIVSHPKDSKLSGKNLFDLSRGNDLSALKKAMQERRPLMEHRFNGTSYEYNYYLPITFSGLGQTWYFVISAPASEVEAAAVSISNFTVGMSAGATVLVLLLIFVVVRANVRPMVYLAGVAKEVADGNLQVQVDNRGLGGEVGQLAGSMKEMLRSLVENIQKAEAMSADAKQQAEKAQEAMGEARKASKDAEARRDGMLHAADKLEELAQAVSSAMTELSAQIAHSEDGATEQAARVASTATAMSQMNSTVLEVARNASQASDGATTTRQKAEGGAQIVAQVVQGIQAVQEQSLALKDDMETLGGHAHAISQIMSVISDIADQTNLLALNAAIEAARAGEAGRGFAVVADEVRKLAEKTMTSTVDVGNAIRAIQQSADKSRTQVDATVKTIENATSLAEQSGAALEEIVTLVDMSADQVRAIATASEEQSATSDEITQSIGEVNSIANENAIAMQEATRAINDLATQSQVLSSLIDEMKRS